MAVDRSNEGRTFFGLTFPEEIEGAIYRGFLDNETEHPGLGYSIAYSGPGLEATVYIYDNGLSEIPNDDPSGPLRDEFENAEMGIVLHGNEAITTAPHFIASIAGGPKMLCVSFPVASGGYDWNDSFLGLTAWNDKFVKFRVTAKPTETSETDIRAFVAAWADVLWPEL